MNVITAANLVDIELDAEQRAALLERARDVVVLEWFGRRIAIHFNQPFEADACRWRYRSFLSAGQPELVICAVASDDAEPIFFAQPGSAFRYPLVLRRPGLIAFLADAVTNLAFFGVDPTLTSFHAAAVRIGDSAAAISAVSTGGKSTTALACARRGMRLYSDERCVLIEGMVHPFPRAMNVRAGGIELLAGEAVPNDGGIGAVLQTHAGKDWESVQFSELFGEGALPQPATLAAIFFITGKSLTPRAEALDLEPALHHLLGAALCGPHPGMDRLAVATKLLRQARPYALTLGTPDDTALLVAATTSRARPNFALASP